MQDDELGTVDDYLRAFRAVQAEGLRDHHLAMLRAHFAAPNHTTTWEQLAKEMGYARGNAVNLQYGKLAEMIASQLGITEPPHGFWLHVLADWAAEPDPESGHTAFVLRPVVIEALQRLGVLKQSDAGSAADI